MRRFEILLPLYYNDGRRIESAGALETRSPGFSYGAYIDYYPVMAKSRKINCVRNNEEDTQGLRTELFIHRPNGRIRDRNSYGNDPYPPLG